MLARKMFTTLLVAALVVLALASATSVTAQEGPPQVGIRPVAPPYALHGPYWVGVRDFVIGEGTERPLEVSVWYPALNPDGLEEAVDYQILFKLRADPTIPGVIAGHALRDAAPDMTAAPYPLVVFSHGYTTNRQTYAYLTEHLASYGFVVIAVDYIELYDDDFTDNANGIVQRPLDTQATIAYAETLGESGGALAGLIDMEQFGVAGHSYGGYTALAIGGARLDWQGFVAFCAEYSGDEFVDWTCSMTLPHEADVLAQAGYDTAPEGLWDSWADPGVKAIVSASGDSYLFGEAGLGMVDVPVLALVGSQDTMTLPEWGAYQTYEHVSSVQKALVTFAMADHMIFQWACKDVPALVEIGFFGSCADPIWDLDRTHDLTNHFVTAFLLATLKGDADAAAALNPAAVPPFRGITYEAQGF